MNRVYKVIWSKAKHCYVVTSEIAKGYGKSAGSKGVKALLSGLVALSIAMGGYGLAGAVFVESKAEKDSVYATEVYTTTEADGKFATKTDLDAKANVDKDGKVTAASGKIGTVEITSAGAVSGVTELIVTRDVEAHGNLKVGNGNFTVDGNTGNVTTGYATIGDDLTVKGDTEMKGDLGVKGTLNAADGKFSVGNDGQLSVSSGKFIVDTNGGINIGHGTATIDNNGNITGKNLDVGNGDIKGGQITGAELNVSTGDIKGGQITGTGLDVGAGTINTTGTVKAGDVQTGTLKTGGNAEIGGTLKAGTTTVASLDAGSGLIKTTGDISGTNITGTNITGDNVEVKDKLKTKNLVVTDGLEMNHVTLGSKPDNYTEINMGNVTSEVNDTVGAVKYTAESIFNKDGSSITVRTDEGSVDSTGKSIVGAKGISQYLGNNAVPDPYGKNVTRKMVRNDDGTFSMEDKAVDGTKSSTVSQNAEERKVTATEGKNTASTNLSNKGFNTYATDGTNKTYTKQTATDIKNTAEKGMISNKAKNLVNTASENMTNTVGGNLTTTVTGDSSLTAENITNEAKNKITNKALDVETDAASSIVSKVSNDYGSNTSTQLSHQTKEEMSQADGKTASYLRGAAEEKSQLINGDKKTTIDTIAGQTNTNITEGKNVSNSLQKADQIASSVTDSTNTTVVNQDAKSLASSVTDGTNTTVVNQDARSLASAITDGTGTKVNNSFHWVDGSAQRIEVDDTHFYAETRTAEKAEEALKSGNTVIDIVKDTNTATVSSAVFDDTTNTGISQDAKDISLSAAGGTITNDANDVLNKGANSVINEVGDKQVAVMTDSVKAAYGLDTYTTWDDKGITNNAKDKTVETTAKDIKNTASNSITDKVGENVERTMGTKKIEESVKDGTKSNTFTKTAKKDMNIITDGTNTSTLSQLADKVNTSLKEVDGAGNTTKSLNNVKTVSEDTTKMTDAASGEFSKRSQTVSQIQDKVGKTTVTTIDGKTKLTDEDHNHTTEMDYANVTKDLSVERDTTLGKKGEHTNLTVNSKSEFKDTVKMDSTLEVDGTSKFNDKVTITKNGLDVKDGTTTDTLTVTGTSEFRGKADFKDNVSMGKGLAVAGETKTGTLHVEKDGYVGGNLNVAGNIETHDAVLSADSRQVVTGRQLYQTNERVDRLDNRIKKVGANAAALAALRPGDFNPDDKFSIAAGFGSYRNANAAALGLFYRPNENVLLSLGTSFGDGENMVNAGVSVKFGRGKSMAERRKEMADEVSSMRDEMRSQDERIAELEEMLKKQSELIEKLSKES